MSDAVERSRPEDRTPGHSGSIAALLLAGIREYRRAPVLLALLVVLPAYLIGLFSVVIPASDVVLEVGGQQVETTLASAATAFTAPMVAALLAGVAGLFLMAGVENDGRLLVTGYRPAQVVLARMGLLVLVSLLATAVAIGTMTLTYRPSAPAVFALAGVLAALVYGMLGVIVGIVLDRLAGVYLVLFGSMVDLFLFQNPLATDPPAAAAVLPGHFPMALAMEAAFTGTVDVSALGGSLAALAIGAAVAVIVYHRSMT